MRYPILFVAALAAFLGFASVSSGAGWALTADTPLSYTFDQPHLNKQSPTSGGFAAYDHRSTGDVSGSKVMLISPFHVGVGYEDYSVRQTTTVGSNTPGQGCPAGVSCAGSFRMNVRMVDVAVDIPMRFVNLSVGYGQGEADVDIVLPAIVGAMFAPIRHAAVTQTFVTLGIPLGARLDVHLGYHWVQVAEKDLVNANSGGGGGGAPDKLQASGQMLSAGLRMNF